MNGAASREACEVLRGVRSAAPRGQAGSSGQSSRPLDDIRVLSLTRAVAGRTLSEHEADVLRATATSGNAARLARLGRVWAARIVLSFAHLPP